MRVFGFFIIRWARLQQLHARMRELVTSGEAARIAARDALIEKTAEIFGLQNQLYIANQRIEELELQVSNLRAFIELGKPQAGAQTP